MINLMHGDCMELINRIPDKSIDLMVTDPPYNFGNKGGGFYSNNNSTKRQYADSLMKLNCCDFKPKPFLDAIKSKFLHIYIYMYSVIKH